MEYMNYKIGEKGFLKINFQSEKNVIMFIGECSGDIYARTKWPLHYFNF